MLLLRESFARLLPVRVTSWPALHRWRRRSLFFMKTKMRFSSGLLFIVALLSGCDHAAPLTAEPTGPIETRLIGDWITHDGNRSELMNIRGYDAKNLAVAYEGELYHAWPSTLGNEPFLTIQVLNGEPSPFMYANYRFENNGDVLVIRIVPHEIVPKTASPAAAQDILRKQPPFAAEKNTDDFVRFARVVVPKKGN
jgi:hypothetical protein